MKEYIKPAIEIVRLDMQNTILAGSGEVVNVTFGGEDNDEGYAYDLPTDFPSYIEGIEEINGYTLYK